MYMYADLINYKCCVIIFWTKKTRKQRMVCGSMMISYVKLSKIDYIKERPRTSLSVTVSLSSTL